MERENDSDINCNWRFRYSHQRIDKGTGGLGNKRMGGDYPNNCIVELGQNTEKSHRDLKKIAVTCTPVKDHQLTLVQKLSKE